MKKEPILSVKDLSVSFQMYDNGLEKYDLKVISNLTLDVRPGEIVAIAGPAVPVRACLPCGYGTFAWKMLP